MDFSVPGREFHDTEEEILSLTRFVVHRFYQRRLPQIREYFAPDFIWIGALENQYTKGADAFFESVMLESRGEPEVLSDEEYRILSHKEDTWIVYGRYTASFCDTDGSRITTKTRNTYVWQKKDVSPLLIHIHASNAQDVPLKQTAAEPPSIWQYDDWSDYLNGINQILKVQSPSAKIAVKALDGSQHFFYPYEIAYICSNKNIRYIYSPRKTIATRATLDSFGEQLPSFVRIHRSYLVDIKQIQSIRRYEATLNDGEILPIGKERFLSLRAQLNDL